MFGFVTLRLYDVVGGGLYLFCLGMLVGVVLTYLATRHN